MTKKKNFIVENTDSGKRLDIFLSEKLGVSRSQAQKFIEQHQILLNGSAPKKAGDILKEGNKVKLVQGETKNSTVKAVLVTETPAKTVLKPTVISETADFIVVEKPTGLLTHPTMAGEKETLSSYLSEKYPEIKKVGDDPALRPGIIHRLDKEASGLLVVARTQKMFDFLKDQFKSRTIEKEYLALVHGKVAKDWDIINFPIARSETYDKMAARPRNETAQEGEKEAKTEFFVEKRFVNFTLLRVTLHTGRMHQIRVHMLAYNNPLVGDPLYIQKKRKRVWDDRLGRLFLHSTKLSFTDLEGNRQTFESPLPKELSEFLKKLK